MRDYVIVNSELYNFLENKFKGGPKLPLSVVPEK